MECKNCKIKIDPTAKYCHNCGGKVITKRTSMPQLAGDFVNNVFGWDNRFWVTIKTLILKPSQIFTEYLGGTRRKYVHPFTFLAIAATISLVSFSFMETKLIQLTKTISYNQSVQLNEITFKNLGINDLSPEAIEQANKDQKRIIETLVGWMVQYYNYVMFFSLPIFAFIAFIVYRKPYNYGEHLVINAYILGAIIMFSLIITILSIYVDEGIYSYSSLISALFYLYAYTKLYKHSIWDALLKLLFLGLMGIGLMLLSVVVGFIFGWSDL